MSLAFGLGFPHWQTLAGGFSPASLFANGEQGAWYDINLTDGVLFQDSAGTTPVTAVEQPVGLMLDKSKGLVLGSELFESSSPSGTGWGGINATAVGNVVTFSAQFSNRRAGETTVADKWYRFTFTARRISGNTALHIFHENSASGDFTAFTASSIATSYQVTVRGRTGGGAVNFGVQDRNASGWGDLEVYDLSVKELPGNHAFQSTPTSRPTLSARVNLLTKTEQFDDAAWIKSNTTVAANAVAAPDGTITADKITPTNVSGQHFLQGALVGFVSGIGHIISIFAKPDGYNFLQITTGLSNDYINFNLSTPAVGNKTALYSGSVTTLADGWFKLVITFNSPLTSSQPLQIAALNADTASRLPSFTGDGTSGIYIWGADLRVANDGVGLPAYQRVNTATDYDTAGFPLYLQYDGSNDGFLTNSVDFATVTSDGQARRNLLTFPTAFDNAAWTKTRSSVTANAIVAPDGTLTADKLVEDTTASNTHLILQSPTVVSGVAYTHSVYLKAGERTWAIFQYGNAYAWVNLATGQLGTQVNVAVFSVTSVGNGWYRCAVTWVTSSTTPPAAVYSTTGDNVLNYTGDGTSGIFIWGAQLEVGSTATAFQNIGTDAMSVFAGLRKLSDTAEAVVVELSATVASNNGTFRLAAPHAAATSSYEFESKGTTMRDAIADNYGAPMTNVVTGLANISGDSVTIRVNSMLEETEIADQGSGNFGNYPLYIGRRNNASLPFNGRMYSLIILGRGVTPQQLDQVENYVEQKTFGRALTLTYVDPILTAASEEITMPDGEQIFMSVTYQ